MTWTPLRFKMLTCEDNFVWLFMCSFLIADKRYGSFDTRWSLHKKVSLQYPRRKRRVCCLWNRLKIRKLTEIGFHYKMIGQFKAISIRNFGHWKAVHENDSQDQNWMALLKHKAKFKEKSVWCILILSTMTREWEANVIANVLLHISGEAKPMHTHTWHTLQIVKYPVKSIQMLSTVVFPYFDCVSIKCV